MLRSKTLQRLLLHLGYIRESGACAAAAAAPGGRALLWTASAAGFVDLTINADNRQDHDRSHLAIRRTIHR
jgi:hypothetical protein